MNIDLDDANYFQVFVLFSFLQIFEKFFKKLIK